jgi:hypothetical protein
VPSAALGHISPGSHHAWREEEEEVGKKITFYTILDAPY